jgi:hypothetical protein
MDEIREVDESRIFRENSALLNERISGNGEPRFTQNEIDGHLENMTLIQE